MKQIANKSISIEFYASNVTIGIDLGIELDLEIVMSNIQFAVS